jgi:hypothetical protein
LRVGIARRRSYASVLVIPRRKTSLCEAPHARQPWPELKLHGRQPWERTGEGKEGGGGGEAGGAPGGRAAGGAPWGWPLRAAGCLMRALCRWLAAVREDGRRKEGRKEKEEKKREQKRKKYQNFFILENF